VERRAGKLLPFPGCLTWNLLKEVPMADEDRNVERWREAGRRDSTVLETEPADAPAPVMEGVYGRGLPPGRGTYVVLAQHPDEELPRWLTVVWEPVQRVWLIGRCSLEALGYRVVKWRKADPAVQGPEPADGFWDVPL